MDKSELFLVPQREQAGERRVQTKTAVERQGALVRARTPDRDRRTHLVVGALAVRHDDIETVDGTAQHNDDEPPRPVLRRPARKVEREQRRSGRQSKKLAPL